MGRGPPGIGGREALRRRLRRAAEFAVYLYRRFFRDECLRHAATLSYTTLLAIVPLVTVVFTLLAAFPVFEPITDKVRLFIFSNLVPTSGEVVHSYIERFSSKATQLTAAGTIGLLATALLLMSAVDQALNEIAHVQRRRSPVQGFLIYWALLTMGPLLMGASLAMTSYLEALSALDVLGLPRARQALLSVVPLGMEFLAFLFLYQAVPNRRVPLRHAALGALLAALLFELAKRAFAWYVTSFPTYEAIYGALAALPVFLLWLYLSWFVVLLGAEFTQALSAFDVGRGGALSDPKLRLILAVRLVGHLWYAQRHGRVASRRSLARREPAAGEDAIQDCLLALEQAKVVVRSDRGWALARDPGHYTLLDLYRSQPFVLPAPTPAFGERDEWDRRLGALLRQVNEETRHALDVPLYDLYAEPPRPSAQE